MDPVLLIFAGLAAFVMFRLISVLGSREGHEQSHDIEALQRAARGERREEAGAEERARAAAPLGPVSENAQPLRASDPSFDEGAFLEGARSAYEMIIEAFAEGDLKSIRQYLSRSVYDAFKNAVAAREDAGHRMELQFVGIERAAIVDSKATDNELIAVTEFFSNQVRVTRDKDGNVVDGDPNRIDLVKDRWTFSRPRGGVDPNWTLIATGAAA